MKIGYHVTRDIASVKREGFVRPMRLPNVYVFRWADHAAKYLQEFGGNGIAVVEIPRGYTARSWKAKYGDVIKIKTGLTLKLSRHTND